MFVNPRSSDWLGSPSKLRSDGSRAEVEGWTRERGAVWGKIDMRPDAAPTGGLVGSESHLGVSRWWPCLCAAIFRHLGYRYSKFDERQTTQAKEAECRALESCRYVLRCS